MPVAQTLDQGLIQVFKTPKEKISRSGMPLTFSTSHGNSFRQSSGTPRSFSDPLSNPATNRHMRTETYSKCTGKTQGTLNGIENIQVHYVNSCGGKQRKDQGEHV